MLAREHNFFVYVVIVTASLFLITYFGGSSNEAAENIRRLASKGASFSDGQDAIITDAAATRLVQKFTSSSRSHTTTPTMVVDESHNEKHGVMQKPICQSSHPQFALSQRNTTACKAGYEVITTVEECVRAAQSLKVIPSDTNGDGESVPVSDTARMDAWVKQREVASGDTFGAGKPYGCYKDVSERIVAGKEEFVTEIWLSHYKLGGQHEDSAPMCKRICEPAPIVSETTTPNSIPHKPKEKMAPNVFTKNLGLMVALSGGAFCLYCIYRCCKKDDRYLYTPLSPKADAAPIE